MAENYGNCSLCRKGRLLKKGEKEVGGATYIILKCEQCSYEVARSVK